MQHTLEGYYATKTVYLDGKELHVKNSYLYRKFSPTFDWGDCENGSRQLALAVVLEITGLYTGFSSFKVEVISGLPKSNFKINFDLDNRNVRRKIMIHAHAVNKVLSYEHLKMLSNSELLANVHPLEREELEKEIGLVIK